MGTGSDTFSTTDSISDEDDMDIISMELDGLSTTFFFSSLMLPTAFPTALAVL
jgi:hypothetical protein